MYACLDIETTGLNPKDDDVIEIGILIFDNEKILKEWRTFIKCPIRLPEFTKRLTGITDEMLKDAPLLSEVESEMREILRDFPIMGHFIFFDLNFLAEKKIRLLNKQLDTCQLAQVFLPDESSYSLEVLVDKLGIKQDGAHRALNDVKANVELFHMLRKHVAALSKEEKESLLPILEKSNWPWAKFVIEFFDGEGKKIERSIKINKKNSGEKHFDLIKECEDLKTPFFIQEFSHTDQDILDYALSLPEKSLIAVSDIESFPDHEESVKLKDSSEYLDEKRFEHFISKDKLDVSETMLALKVKLWLSGTKTGEKSELRLFKDENGLWKDICCQEGDNTSFYKKRIEQIEEKKVMVIDHIHFLRDRSRAKPLINLPENLLVAGCEELPENLEIAWKISLYEKKFIEDLGRLHSENINSDFLIENFSNRISILFGLLGIAVHKHGDGNEMRHTLIVEDETRATQEWKNVRDSAEGIETALSALLAQTKDSPTKSTLERYLTYFCKSLKGKSVVLWINFDRSDQPVVHTFPENCQKIFAKNVWHPSSACAISFFSHHGNLKDDFKFLKTELSLPENTEFKTVESTAPRPIFYPETNISSPNNEKNISESCHEISLQIEKMEGNLFLLVNSMSVGEQFFYNLEPVRKKFDRKLFVQNMSGGLGKILKIAEKTDGKNIFVGNQEMLEFLTSESVKINFLAIHRLPFSHPSDPIQMSRSKNYENTYDEFVLPQAALKFQKILNKFLDNSWEGKKILIMDPRISENESLFIG